MKEYVGPGTVEMHPDMHHCVYNDIRNILGLGIGDMMEPLFSYYTLTASLDAEQISRPDLHDRPSFLFKSDR